jgi:5-methylthioadenosine/S-adenosylhomocysteine deaminase
MLIRNATIITQNENRDIIRRGFVRIEKGLIIAVGLGDSGTELGSGEEIIDASGYIISPGFINAHVHLGETIYCDFFRGYHTLESYIELTNKISSASKAIELKRRSISDYSVLQLIKNGTTTIAGGRTNESAEFFGIKNVSGYMLMQSPKLGEFGRDMEAKFDVFYRESDTLLTRPALFIHSLGTVSEDVLLAARNLKEKYADLTVMVHVAETMAVERESKKKFGLTSVQALQRYGLLDDRTVLIHGNNLSNDDIALMRRARTPLVHCLSSNLCVADSAANISELIKQEIPVSIATDGVVTAGTFDVLSEARRCYVYHNRFCNKESFISEQEIWDMITVNPAKALGLFDEVGSIEIGKKADIVFFKESLKTDQPISYLLRSDLTSAEGVLVGGDVLLWENKLVTVNEPRMIEEFLEVVGRVKADLVSTGLLPE